MHEGELPGGTFLVDRLVTTRPSKPHNVSIIDDHHIIIIKINNGAQRHVEYLVLCKRYPKEEASWVLDTDVTAPDFCIILCVPSACLQSHPLTLV